MWQNLRSQVQHELSTSIDLTRWVGSIGLAVAVGIVYFVAARLSLALLTKPEGVAVFWPAAGVSAGVLIALGSRARWPVVVGTMAATIAANLSGDRDLWSAVFFAFLLYAHLLHWVKNPLKGVPQTDLLHGPFQNRPSENPLHNRLKVLLSIILNIFQTYFISNGFYDLMISSLCLIIHFISFG